MFESLMRAVVIYVYDQSGIPTEGESIETMRPRLLLQCAVTLPARTERRGA
jgi:hypothetical protein